MAAEDAAWRDGTENASITHPRLDGKIRFKDGFWKDSPLSRFRFEDGLRLRAAG